MKRGDIITFRINGNIHYAKIICPKGTKSKRIIVKEGDKIYALPKNVEIIENCESFEKRKQEKEITK